MHASLPSHDIVLVGAGHTNMHVARMWRMAPIPGSRLTIVSPFSRATYSGMLPGTLAGQYSVDDMEIDLYRFTGGTDIRLIVEPAVGLDPERRRILFADRPPVRYDIASIGMGSVPAGRSLWESNERVMAIKPMATFLSRLKAQLADVTSTQAESPVRIGIVGAGAAGTEISFCLHSYLQSQNVDGEILLIEGGEQILPGYARSTVRIAERELLNRGVRVHTQSSVVRFTDSTAHLANGDALEVDLLIWAIAAAPPPELKSFRLPKAGDGFLATRPTLQTTGGQRVFAVGDSGTIVANPQRKAGVYAVREGPILWKNIRRMLQDRPLVKYDPQQDFLSLISTGDGNAILQYYGVSTYGKWVWNWKDAIDRRFMKMYQEYGGSMSSPAHEENGEPVMKCRGCGGKVGANVLSAALERLDIPQRGTRQGLNEPDDAAILDPQAGTAEVVSVDFFPSFLEDPYLVGRVAALNSLSDLWATGAQPLGAMAMVTLPAGEPRQQTELLYQVLAGGLREITQCGATLWGGHTTEGPELTIGYTVIGDLQGQAPLTKGGLTTGLQLILAKPLGTGVLLAAQMEGAARGQWMDELMESMVISNQRAGEIARCQHSPAVTDVTGFGLAGHLLEMLDASQHNATIDLASLPLYSGVAELTRRGIFSTLYPANSEVQDRIDVADEKRDDCQFHAMFDPQTSGGLLLAVDAEQVEKTIELLRESGYPRATRIGAVTDATSQPRIQVD